MQQTELREQARVVRWSHLASARELMPELRWLHHSPNGGRRDGFTGAQMKALGTKAGFPDLILPVRQPGSLGSIPGLIIEMKTSTGTTSALQDDWLDHFDNCGWVTALARSADEARAILCRYLAVDPDSAPPLP